MTTILIAEDTDDVRMVLHRVFVRVGFTVEVAADGAEALEMARRRPPDVVLTDFNMPRLDGLQLCQAIRADPVLADVPVAILSGDIQPDDRRFAGEQLCGVWLKPFRNADLVAAVQRLVQAGPHRHDGEAAPCRSGAGDGLGSGDA
ncbi:response regulator [Actinoplanes sp. NPDC049316]|uniref:response regulator n=1 Tax=Actinoplanes sp. NPDC049316 TaxID=3154727 RepID=UPI003437BAED